MLKKTSRSGQTLWTRSHRSASAELSKSIQSKQSRMNKTQVHFEKSQYTSNTRSGHKQSGLNKKLSTKENKVA